MCASTRGIEHPVTSVMHDHKTCQYDFVSVRMWSDGRCLLDTKLCLRLYPSFCCNEAGDWTWIELGLNVLFTSMKSKQTDRGNLTLPQFCILYSWKIIWFYRLTHYIKIHIKKTEQFFLWTKLNGKELYLHLKLLSQAIVTYSRYIDR